MHTAKRFVSRLTRQTLALVLAGGRGSRLHDLTKWRAKPAVPFGGKFRIIDFPLSNCINSGIGQVGVITQYKSHSLIRHIQRGWGFLRGEMDEFVELLPAQQRIETSWYEGTADAVLQNLDIIRSHHPEYVLILAGDHIYKMDYGTMLAAHVESEADITVGCIEVPIEEASALGVMSVDDEYRIREFEEKPAQPRPMPGNPGRALASMGIYVFNTRVLFEELIRDHQLQERSSHDFGKDVIPSVIRRLRVMAFPFRDPATSAPAYWRDVGTVDALWQANLELIGVSPELNLYDSEWPIWTYQEQLPPAKFVFDDDNRRGTAVDSMVAGGCIVSGAQVKHSLLFSQVRVHSFSEVTDSVIFPDVEIGRNCRVRKALIDRGCRLAPGTVVGFDPDEDRKRFHVSSKGVVLITPEMLGQDYPHGL
ncbi:glucose-1-phosphate adenylyltransferase [Marinobacter lutaoensis]|jgi:glucose-1-phosphate adenylyltransferase|uniref:Glucose-1-phosphate adenylyltransferase n=1 Tax=Marinobacter lutaoensis TaxID=135739 RepID=A0A1V2DUX9_9GAMM|nr:glucose-1-phosphate adenylyltransferase [Marinobacter lutaoensis]MBE02911.1 glucose-1-phosphate adenylyltransferase [Marinobacter sp.]MBI42456.1 glucose-1-phosphate adenylyltransferase [Oceanospirillales bacterium]ONF44111.1 glucose-1-phosphate adenylyltransferase [Marinobacter lutaoensis]|tara:strand:+ start:523 stop:1788 length:1266 start_codon:yes stop_codon:yes gene_type:complete